MAEHTTRNVHEDLAPNSVELSTNAKGKIQPNVKVYHADPKEAARLAVETLKQVREQLAGQLAE